MKYYSILRPIGPGTFPTGYKVNEIVNFDRRQYCKEINREAWGYIDFDGEIEDKDADAYDLVRKPREMPSRGCARRVPLWQPADDRYYDELDYAEGRCLGDSVD